MANDFSVDDKKKDSEYCLMRQNAIEMIDV